MSKTALTILKSAAGFAAVIAFLYLTGIGCPVRFVTGLSCPGCGLSRAWAELFRGNIRAAFAYHPLFWSIPLILIVLAPFTELSPKFRNIFSTIMAGLFIIVYVVRIVYHDPVLTFQLSEGFIMKVIGGIADVL